MIKILSVNLTCEGVHSFKNSLENFYAKNVIVCCSGVFRNAHGLGASSSPSAESWSVTLIHPWAKPSLPEHLWLMLDCGCSYRKEALEIRRKKSPLRPKRMSSRSTVRGQSTGWETGSWVRWPGSWSSSLWRLLLGDRWGGSSCRWLVTPGKR